MYQQFFSQRNRKLIFSVIFIVCIFVIFFTIREGENIIYNKPEQTVVKEFHDYTDELSTIKAKSFFVYDVYQDKVLFSYDEHRELPLASVTKLMSGFIVLNLLPATTIVDINQKDIAAEGDSGLVVGEKWQLKNLLDFSLISSSNDGIEALSRTLNSQLGTTTLDIVKLMNQKARDLGLDDTLFINTTGLDINTHTSGAYSSSHDISILLARILKENPTLVSATKNTSESFLSLNNIKHTALNTNTIIGNIPNLIASKTGFTDLAGGNLAIAFDAGFNHPVIVVVLGSTVEDRFTDVSNLVRMSLEKLSE